MNNMKTRIIMLLALLAGTLSLRAGDGVTATSATVPQGGTGIINIVLQNDSYQFTAFSMKLTLPEGISFVPDEEDGSPTFEKGTRFRDHSLSSNASGQTATFACLSLKNAAITGTGGILLSVPFTADASLPAGTVLTATLSELTFTTAGEQEVSFPDVSVSIVMASASAPTVKGDVNGDGRLDISDVTAVVNLILGK